MWLVAAACASSTSPLHTVSVSCGLAPGHTHLPWARTIAGLVLAKVCSTGNGDGDARNACEFRTSGN